MPQVSLSTSTNFDGDLNALVEDQGTALTVRFDLDEPAPEGGLKVYVDSEVEQIVNRLDLVSFISNPTVENINPNLLGTNFDNSGFFLTIDGGSTTASFTIDVFDNPEPDTFLPATFDGLVEAALTLTTEVEPQDLADVGTLGDYTIDPNAASSTVLFADDASQLTDTPEPPTEPPTQPPTSGLPLVSLNTGPDFLVEEEGTVSAHVFNVTNATIPEEGLLVSVSAPGLGEFDLDAINVSEGGEIVDVRDDGFDIRLTDFTVLVDLPIADDGETEGLETASFSLESGAGYEVNSDFSSGEFTLVDTADELPVNTSNRNDIIPLARDVELSPDNPEVTINDTLGFSIGNRYQNADGSFTYIDQSEDVDFYKFDLQAGDVIAIDNDSLFRNNPAIIDFPEDDPFGGYMTVRLFDDEGNELVANGAGQAPGEIFVSFDQYIEFKAPADGTYYAGISQFRNGTTQRIGAPEIWNGLAYDPLMPGTGDGQSFTDYPGSAEYELKFTLNPDNPVLLAEQRDRSNNTPPETIDLAQGNEPTVSLNFTAATYASFEDPAVLSGEINRDDVIGGSLIEGFPRQGSILNLVVTAEGEIPEEGLLVTVNSDSYLRDYFSVRTLANPTFIPGNQFVDLVTDDTGRETGFQVRLFEPVATIPLNLRTPQRGELVEPGPNGLEPSPETDGPEEVTFFLEGGDGYGVSATENQVTPTFYDSVEQAPEPSVIPEVSISISEDVLIESEGTQTTLNFSLSEAPPEEGVLIHVRSNSEGLLPQFEAP
ncbi:MAG: PPC domain-containing protein [Cyanobacteria bacterium P01_A01_bin.116]